MLDTFAKRLNSQHITSPGDVSASDRWSIAGSFKPSPEAAGLIVATLGALAAHFVGTNTNPPGHAWVRSDRWHVEFKALPGTQDVYNRYAYAGNFKFQGDGTVGGKIAATLGSLSASLRGTNSSLHVDGRLGATLGPLSASLRGDAYYGAFFDVDYSITPAFTPTVLTASQGKIAATLGALTAALRGQALPPNSSNGQLLATLGPLTSSLRGTFSVASARDGKLKGDLGPLTAGLRGTSVPPQSNIGAIQATLGPLTASMRGATVPPHSDGRIVTTLGPLTAHMFGQSLLPGTIYGLINASLGGITVALKGESVGNMPPPRPGKIFVARHKNRTFVVKRTNRETKV